MMSMELRVEIVVALLPIILIGTAQATSLVYRSIHNYALSQCVLRIARMLVAPTEPTDRELSLLRYIFTNATLLEALTFIAEYVYGGTANRLMLIVEECKVDRYMLKRIGRSTSVYGTTTLLAEMSQLPPTMPMVECAEFFVEYSSRASRFHAVAILVAASPMRALYYINRFYSPLTIYEVAVLTQIMCRMGTTIAYTPLLTSQNRNLQLIGIYFSLHFSAVDAEPHLQRLAESSDGEVAYLALHTLCVIRGDISSPQVGRAMGSLTPHLRSAFIRAAVQNCYTLSSCSHILTRKERSGFINRMNSYKCQIVCN